MSHDRIEGDVIRITHDYSSAVLLGSRRLGVTTGLHVLEGLLDQVGTWAITIRNRPRLEVTPACPVADRNRYTSGCSERMHPNSVSRREDYASASCRGRRIQPGHPLQLRDHRTTCNGSRRAFDRHGFTVRVCTRKLALKPFQSCATIKDISYQVYRQR